MRPWLNSCAPGRREQRRYLHSRLRKQKAPPKRGFSFERSKLTDKPGSVVDSHSSRPAIAHWLKQPTRVQYGPYHVNPYLALLRVEFTVPRTVTSRAVRSYRTLSPLPDPLRAIGGLLSVALVVGLRPPGVTWHPALWSPDFPPLCLSPPKRTTTKRRLPGQLRRG